MAANDRAPGNHDARILEASMLRPAFWAARQEEGKRPAPVSYNGMAPTLS